MRLLFMGTPLFAVPTLRKLHASSHQVVAVFTQPDKPTGRGEKVSSPPVKQVALEFRFPVYQPERLRNEEWQPTFRAIQAEAFVVVAYGKILPVWLLNLPQYGALNLHASLLPKYRGAAPIHWAIASGETVTGVTTMKIDAGMDTGDILLQEAVEIGPNATTAQVHDQLAELGAELMVTTLNLLEQGQLKPIPQPPQLASYAPQLKKSDGELNWERTAIELYDRIRAFNPWPGTYAYLQGRMLRIWKACPVDLPAASHSPGTLIHCCSYGAVVACRRGFLQLLEVQLENRKKISASDFLHGIRLPEDATVLLGR